MDERKERKEEMSIFKRNPDEIKLFDVKSGPSDSFSWSGEEWKAEVAKDFSSRYYSASFAVNHGVQIRIHCCESAEEAAKKLEQVLRQTNACLNVLIHKTGLK